MPKTSRASGPSGDPARREEPLRPSNTIAAVVVDDPTTDVRPDTPQVVLWVGGDTRPANMDAADLWIDAGAVMSGNTVGGYPDLVSALLQEQHFLIAHRGGWEEGVPEHSESAYRRALTEGYAAVEMSAHTTADGAQVCHHDATLDRCTTLSGNISAKSLGQLRAAIIDIGATTGGPGFATAEPLPILGTELSLWAHNGVIFLEPKADGPRTLAAALQIPEPGKTIIWKYGRSGDGSIPSHAQAAVAAGMKQWIYMTNGDARSLIDTVVANIGWNGGALGMPLEEDDADIAYAVAAAAEYNLPVIVWPVQRRWQRDRLYGLGVRGLMCTNPSYVGNDTARFTSDGYSGGVRRAGMFESASNKLITQDPAGLLITLAQGTTATLSHGDMCPVPDPTGAGGGYRIKFDMRWPVLPGSSEHSDVYFGHADDTAYNHAQTDNDPGYHFVFRGNGDLQVYTHVNGSGTGTQLGTASTTTPVANTWMSFEIDVNATQVIVRRTDVDPDVAVTVSNTANRGAYFGLASATSSQAPQFRNVSVVEL